MRLDKMLSHSGYGTRKEVKNFIRKGNVMVNGEIIKDDDFKVDELNDEVIVDGLCVDYSKHIYLMLNKPSDYISATFDNRHETVIDIVSEFAHFYPFPVGRLDIDTEGLLLITNDGALAHKLLSPKSHVFKKYYVSFSGSFKEEYHNNFSEGITLDDGYTTLPASCKLIDDSSCYVTIREGKFHQVKRMFLALDMKVEFLQRIEFGPLKLDENLAIGEYRELNQAELDELFSC